MLAGIESKITRTWARRSTKSAPLTVTRSRPLLTYSLRRDDSVVVFCLSEPEDTEAFANRFAGELFRAGR
jgi:hypothetical protein